MTDSTKKTAPGTSAWVKAPLEGCVSSDGSPYSVYLKKGTVNKLLVSFQGGGLSWNEQTAAGPILLGQAVTAPPGKEVYYIANVPEGPMRQTGILDPNDERNPFHGWNAINLPYTTADFYLGDNDFPYVDDSGESRILHHHGKRNSAAALALLKETFPETPDVLVIVGQSAGGYGCLALAPQIEKLYPGCNNIVVYSDGTHFCTPYWPEIATGVWKASSDLVAYIRSENLIADIFRYAQDNMPVHTLFLHSNTLWDRMLVQLMRKMNHGQMQIDQAALNEYHDTLMVTMKKLRESISNYTFFLTDHARNPQDGTTPHTFSGNPELLFSELQEGMSVASWLDLAINKRPQNVGEDLMNQPE
jgi:hypothetical protein